MKYIKIMSLFALLVVASGCKKWLDVNTDPATPQVARAEFYLAPIIAQMGINSAMDYRDVQSKYTQNLGNQAALDQWERQGWAPTDVGTSMWRHVYISAGLNLEDMIKNAEAKDNFSYAGIGYAIKAWGFQMLTDIHGPIVLDEAFEDKLTFTYQDQPEVYARVREWCQMALVRLNKTDVGDYTSLLKSTDYMYQGDRTKWKKFVYALLAQQYSHLINKPDFASKYADSVIKYVDLSFASSAEDATIGYNGNFSYVSASSPGDSNPLSLGAALVTGAAYGRIGQPIVNYLTGGVRGTPTVNPKSSIDPRLTRMINPMSTPTVPATDGVYKGVVATKGDVPTTKTIPHMLGSTTPTATAPFPGKYIFDKTARLPIITYAQLQFAKAEALFIKGDKEGAYAAYLNGIKGHMDFINLYGRNGTVVAPTISATEINAYLASSEVAQNSADLKIADIMGQKYIAQWGWAGYEQWCDLRKYHYDPLVFTQFKPLESSEFYAFNGGKYAYRLGPRFNSEYAWNMKELQKWGADKNDYHTLETWFSLPN